MNEVKLKKLEHPIICFFDENKIKEFYVYYKSLELIYESFKILVYIDFDKSLFDEYNLDYSKVSINLIDRDRFNIFSKNSTPNHIDSVMTFGRLLLNEEFDGMPEKFIYSDIDIMVINPFEEKYLNSEENFVFKTLPVGANDDELWDVYFKYKHESFLSRNYFDHIFFKSPSEKILDLIKEKEYFNAGFIIVNNSVEFGKLTKSIVNYHSEYYKHFDDQDLLNLFNEKHLVVVNDVKYNCVAYSLPFNGINHKDNIINIHFAGNKSQKELMIKISENDFDYNILFDENINPSCESFKESMKLKVQS